MTVPLLAAGFARGGFVLFGLLVPLMVVGLVAYGIWELVRSRTPAPAGTGPSVGARAVLDERFARGEIDADEYLHRRALLDGTAPTRSAAPPPPRGPASPEEPATAPSDPVE